MFSEAGSEPTVVTAGRKGRHAFFRKRVLAFLQFSSVRAEIMHYSDTYGMTESGYEFKALFFWKGL